MIGLRLSTCVKPFSHFTYSFSIFISYIQKVASIDSICESQQTFNKEELQSFEFLFLV